MSELIVVTNRRLCSGDFLKRVEDIAKTGCRAIILREKDLDEKEYIELAAKASDICRKYGKQCILHYYWKAAKESDCKALHLPVSILASLSVNERSIFKVLGASCHSKEDAELAESLGCTYITAGHIFETDCKAGMPGRGLDFLKDICENVSIPVYAIGGITPENYKDVLKAGARGACVMSSAMTADNAGQFISQFEKLS